MRHFLFLLLSGLFLNYTLKAQEVTKPLRVATYNLRLNVASDGQNAWPNRKEMVKNLVRYHNFDVFGTQEGFRGQLNDVAELPEYTFVGHGRDDGKEAGEHSAIFYKKSRLKMLQTGDFWLSQTPDKPSKGWDATCCNRICTWAKFQDLKTKREFYFFSVHFDHEGVKARRQSGKLMAQKIQEIAKNAPVICVGDFNSIPSTEQIKTMQALLQDAFQVTKQPPYGPVGTFQGFKLDAPLQDRIDYVFVSKQFDVLDYAVLTDSMRGLYPSDHFTVLVNVVLK
ncbi:endonuclease/exonuclease/phosphatase family protein [Hymenobacter taeanensis]|uniref:Endonuclease/exonuclease/phosphatase family protein n=1 Tax=Hymenobacter taeanensis TaxID=2735321 RepID=A0A6M6BF05_9BACT|nr:MULTISPECIES: endonuclease/exonuclease/phosphatase family protein [Hymenobacter]QJX45813.1 endonuclease/exonuclease/phosphatase family protein [Hymenobacter taeanensis]UOQ79657.1 endonuclease/exonuclease/phosphatase family protein [Hymenobacter sp. 5414T-23]